MESEIYGAEYYKQNKEGISAHKKERYQTDPMYRDAIQIRALARKRAISEERKMLRKMGFVKIQRKIRPYQVHVNDKIYLVPMLTIGRLALSLNRKIITIRLWERKGIIPRALYRTKKGERLYTVFQVKNINQIYREEIKKFGIKVLEHRISNTGFIQKVRDFWEEFPLGFDINKVKYE